MLSAKCRWLWGPRAPDAHCAPSVPQTGPARPLRPQASAHLRVFRLSQGHPATCERSRQRQCHTRSCPHRPDRETGPGPSSLCLPTPQLPHRKGPTILGGPGPSCSATPSPRLPSPCPSGTKARCTHRLAVPSGGAILPWRAWGSLQPRDKSCIGAGHQRACGVLGGEGAGWGPHARLSGRPPLCPPAPRAGLSITQGRAGGRTETGGVGARPGRPGHPLARPTCCLCSGQNPPGTPTSCWARGMERKGVRPGPSGQCAGTRHGAALGRGGGLTSSRLSSGLRTFPSPVAAVCEPGRVWAGWGRGGQTPGQRPRLSLAALSAPRAARRPLGPA